MVHIEVSSGTSMSPMCKKCSKDNFFLDQNVRDECECHEMKELQLFAGRCL